MRFSAYRIFGSSHMTRRRKASKGMKLSLLVEARYGLRLSAIFIRNPLKRNWEQIRFPAGRAGLNSLHRPFLFTHFCYFLSFVLICIISLFPTNIWLVCSHMSYECDENHTSRYLHDLRAWFNFTALCVQAHKRKNFVLVKRDLKTHDVVPFASLDTQSYRI